jgi:hypothetical protein
MAQMRSAVRIDREIGIDDVATRAADALRVATVAAQRTESILFLGKNILDSMGRFQLLK